MPDAAPQNSEVVGHNPVFATTHWSVVMRAGKVHSSQSVAALEKLCRTYWFPLFAFIRRKGRSEEDARDLTQAFFAQLLERGDFQTVEARKGKFRTFLLTSLTHFLANDHDRTTTLKRGGGKTILSLDEMSPEQFQRYEPATTLSPDKLFDQRWAMALLQQAVARLKLEMSAEGKEEQFAALKKFLVAEPDEGEYAAVAGKIGSTSQSVAVAVHRLRQRYRELVRAEVAETVASPLDVDEEMRHLSAALNL